MLKKIKDKIYVLLRASEKIVKTDMIYLTKNSFWLNVSQMTSAASSFILSIAFANFLPQEQYGNYKYILSIIGILSIFTLSGVNSAISQAIASGKEIGLKPILNKKIKWGSIGGLISLILGLYYFPNHDLAIAFFISAIFIPFLDSFNIFDAILSGNKNFKLSAKLNITARIFSIIITVLAIVLTKTLWHLILVYLASWTIIRTVFFFSVYRRYKKELTNTENNAEIMKYGLNLTSMDIVSNITLYLDRFLLFNFVGPAQVALYSVIIAPPEQIKSLLKLVNNLAFPKFAGREIKEIKKSIWRKIFFYLIFLIIVIGAYILICPLFFKLFFPKYTSGIIYSQLFSLSLIIPHLIFLTIMSSHKMTKKLHLVNIFNNATLIIFLLIGINFGLVGIILARMLNRFSNSIFTVFVFYYNKKTT